MKNLIILDYDDTIFPTTDFCMKKGFNQDEILSFKEMVELFISDLLKIGEVIILTNASLSWVQLTSKDLLGYDLSDKIPTYCAKETLESMFPNQNWKTIFLADFLFNKDYDCLIGIGDAETDRECLLHFSSSFVIKNFKIKDRPKISELFHCLKLLKLCLEDIAKEIKSLDLMLQITYIS